MICDEATGLAEKYSQKKATSLSLLEKYITADIVVLMLLIGYEFIKAIQYAAMIVYCSERYIWMMRQGFRTKINVKNY